MMKFSYLSLLAVISMFTVSQRAYANPENFPNITIEDNKAANLLTHPATINTTWSNLNGQTNNLKQTANSISVVQEQGCKINPLEIINKPDSFFKPCQQQTNNQSPQRTEPVEYLKVPRLDSGISVTVTKF
jgi:hypothetical protein